MSLKRWVLFTANVIRQCFAILRADYPYCRALLLKNYLDLVTTAVCEGLRTRNEKKNWESVSAHRILSYTVLTTNSHSLLTLFEEIFIHQVYRLNSKHDRPNIIDCGSNIGLSILYFKTVFPNSTVTGFEPHKETFVLLVENLRNNGLGDVQVFNVALSQASGIGVLFADPARSLNMTLKSSLGGPQFETAQVRTEILSTYVREEIDLLKIDVEGSEEEIIRDLISSGKINLINSMVVEYHHGSLKATLDSFVKLVEDQNFRLSKGGNITGGDLDTIIRFTRVR